MTQIRLSEKMAPSFFSVHQDVKRHGHTYYVLAGGRGSTKSSYVSLEILLLLMQNPDCHAVIMRKVGATLRNSVFAQMEWALDALHISDKWKRTVSPMEFTRKATGQKILFLGVDDKSKVKSIKLPFGYVGITWYEELDQFAGMEEIRNLNQSLMRGGSKFWCFSSYNPPQSANNWVNEEMLDDPPERLFHTSTYLDVNPAWLGPQFISDAERLKEKNETAYRHEYLGEITGTGGAVFENVEDRPMSNDEVSQFDRIHYGLDFGFAVDPLAFVAMQYDSKHEDIYIYDELYQQKLSNHRAAEMIIPRVARRKVVADSAEPKSIAELRGYGMNIIGARKGPDSVAYGIKWLQDRAHIYIDKRRCPNTYREFVSYEYDRNRQGQYISSYPDKDNHALDATRYAMEDEISQARLRILR